MNSSSSPSPVTPDLSLLVRGKYVCTPPGVRGDIADLCPGYAQQAKGCIHDDEERCARCAMEDMDQPGQVPLIIKAAREAEDDDLMHREHVALTHLHKQLAHRSPHLWMYCLPKPIDSFFLGGTPGKNKRRTNVMEYFPGFLNAAEIHQRMPALDGRTLAWMWKRLLIMIDWVYNLDWVHGAVLPPHIMFYPDNDGGKSRDPRKHSIRLIDWCYSFKRTDGPSEIKAWVPYYEAFYAPEILAKTGAGQGTDIYMAAKTMIYLAGGDVSTNAMPDAIPSPIQDSFLACLNPDRKQRPLPGRHCESFMRILESVYGPPRFHPFVVPLA